MIKNKEIVLWKLILIRLSIILLLLSTSRWLIYIFNTDNFSDLSFSELIRHYFVGFRFDLHTLIVFNSPLIILYSLPFKFKYKNAYKKVVDTIFIITNSITIALNLIDVIYYRYLDKRMSSELFTFFKGTDDNQANMLLSFVKDFWFMFLIFFTFLFIIIILTKKTRLKETYYPNDKFWYINQSTTFVLLMGLSVLGIRGGFQLKPITLITATDYTTTQYIPLIINTPFNMIMSSTSASLDKITYFDDSKIDDLYSPIHNDLKNNRFIKTEKEKQNVVLIILESFGQEMIGFYNSGYEHSLTPFLDSLFRESLTFDGIANGRRSIEALPSIFSGLPALMPTDYPSSKYAVNRLDGFGSILKENGYRTAFFHGGNNGTMSFNSTAKTSGFDDYYGRNEYNNNHDFDGTWGIFDGPFLQYTANTLNQYEEPFAAVIFTLSSHHPYSLPDGYSINDLDNATAFEKTIRYVDDALKSFFATLYQYEWFENTLFVITADHVSPEHTFDAYKNIKGTYQVPIAFYSKEMIDNQNTNEIAQHIDLGVSILSALNIEQKVFSFGRNIFDSIQKPNYINYLNNIYQFYDGHYLMESDGTNIKSIYDLENDPLIKNNLYQGNKEQWNEIDKEFKLRLQQYNNRMINNKLYIK